MAMMHLCPTLPRSTWPGDHDVASWSRTAARASHPSTQPTDQPWLWSIASGLASSTAPWTDPDDDENGVLSEARGSILLATTAYEVWHVAWPVGIPIELSDTLDVQSFCVVEGALRLFDRADPDAPGQRFERGTGAVLTTPHALLVADEPGTSAVHVVLHGEVAEKLPWNVSGRRSASAA